VTVTVKESLRDSSSSSSVMILVNSRARARRGRCVTQVWPRHLGCFQVRTRITARRPAGGLRAARRCGAGTRRQRCGRRRTRTPGAAAGPGLPAGAHHGIAPSQSSCLQGWPTPTTLNHPGQNCTVTDRSPNSHGAHESVAAGANLSQCHCSGSDWADRRGRTLSKFFCLTLSL
jgi:hypothetical protein